MIDVPAASATIPFHDVVLQIDSTSADILAAIERRFEAGEGSAAPGAAVLHFDVRSAPAAELPRHRDGSARLVYESGRGRAYWDDSSGSLELVTEGAHAACSPDSRRTAVHVDEASADAVWTVSRPLLSLSLAEMLKPEGLYFMHAGAIELPIGALLIAGDSGAGKSTLSAALAALGSPFLGDDSVFLESAGPEVRLRSFPDELDLSERSLELLGLAGCPRTRLVGVEKWQLSPHAAGFTIGSPVSRPAAIVFPRLSDGAPELTPLTVDDAFFRLAPNVLLTANVAAQAHLDLFGDLTSSIPSYELGMGASPSQAAAFLLERAGELAGTPRR